MKLSIASLVILNYYRDELMSIKMSDITITVAGPAGSGKTTLLFLLADFLDHTGFKVDVVSDESTHELIDVISITDNFEQNLEQAKQHSKIVISSVQNKRDQ
jgi:nucleoside-triphosphatase THEP1